VSVLEDAEREGPGAVPAGVGDVDASERTMVELPEGDTGEGDTPEGDTPEGDTPEGDTPEGDTPEGDTPEVVVGVELAAGAWLGARTLVED
jgi:hypothetical protein